MCRVVGREKWIGKRVNVIVGLAFAVVHALVLGRRLLVGVGASQAKRVIQEGGAAVASR